MKVSLGALEIDAGLWLPQSRPRLFVVATLEAAPPGRPGAFHTSGVRQAFERLPAALADRWVWWGLQPPPRRNQDLAALLEPDEIGRAHV